MPDDPDKMPDVARRRGGADTLFSAEWFDDNDEFTGARPIQGARQNVAIPSGQPAEAPAAESASVASASPAHDAAIAPVVAPPNQSGPNMVLIVGVLAVVFLGGGCALGALGAGAAFFFGLVPL